MPPVCRVSLALLALPVLREWQEQQAQTVQRVHKVYKDQRALAEQQVLRVFRETPDSRACRD